MEPLAQKAGRLRLGQSREPRDQVRDEPEDGDVGNTEDQGNRHIADRDIGHAERVEDDGGAQDVEDDTKKMPGFELPAAIQDDPAENRQAERDADFQEDRNDGLEQLRPSPSSQGSL
ncbi:MAG: hypothetical protein ACOYM2_05165 [Rectinemataceae bacterium]